MILDIFQSWKSTDPCLLLFFFKCSVAHRLRTVIDYDKLIVLDKGVVSEFDTPWNLIQKEDGIFRNMAMKSGMFAELERIAKEKETAVDHA